MAHDPRVARFQTIRLFTIQFLLGALAGGVALAIAPSTSAQADCRPAIRYGINPSFQTWSSRAIVFSDAVQRVREFALWNNGQQGSRAPLIPPARLGAGWPDPLQVPADQRFGAYLFGSMEGTIPEGRGKPYVITWKGSGHVRLEGPFVVSESNRSSNRVEVAIDPAKSGGNGVLSITWTSNDRSTPVHDVHVWLPGMELTNQIFWPPFLKKVMETNAGLGPHTWRTLDWTRMNQYGRPSSQGGFVFDIAGVITPNSPSQGTLRGVAPEYQVALCNVLGMNLHFQIPHRTSDLSESEYLRFMIHQLEVIRDGSPGIPGLFGGRPFAGLDPSLTVTVELSNEIWNSSFPANGWMAAEARRKGISFSEQVASQIQLLFDVADAVFAGPNAPRLRKYVGSFTPDPGYTRRILSNLNPRTHIDALGPAAYLGPRRPEMDAWLQGSSSGSCPNCPDADGLIQTARNTIDSLRTFLAQHREIANGWTNPDGSHPALELYEGGLNLKSAGEPWAAAAREVQKDPRLFDLLANEYVPMLVEEGVELINWYSFMTDQSSPLVDAYGIWNDMNQDIVHPVVKPYIHQGAPKAAVICLGPPLTSSCARATAVVRQGAGNYDTYRSAPPVLGQTFRAQVNPTVSGNTAAFVVASLTPISAPLLTGQTLLTPLNSMDFLPIRSGPLAVWDVPVPNDLRLAGLAITTQAFHLGGGPGMNLSNAMDLTFGR